MDVVRGFEGTTEPVFEDVEGRWAAGACADGVGWDGPALAFEGALRAWGCGTAAAGRAGSVLGTD